MHESLHFDLFIIFPGVYRRTKKEGEGTKTYSNGSEGSMAHSKRKWGHKGVQKEARAQRRTQKEGKGTKAHSKGGEGLTAHSKRKWRHKGTLKRRKRQG